MISAVLQGPLLADSCLSRLASFDPHQTSQSVDPACDQEPSFLRHSACADCRRICKFYCMFGGAGVPRNKLFFSAWVKLSK